MTDDVSPDQRPDPGGRRPYHSPVRRQQAEQTRRQIVNAGSTLVHGFPSWDWGNLTVRAVAEEAGVSVRTVYRHFPNERELHTAIMRRLEEEAGISYDALSLDDLPDVARRVFASLPSFAVSPWAVGDPPFADEDRRRRDALLTAVTAGSGDWSDDEQLTAAAVLDVLWSVPAYERLVKVWDLSGKQANQAIDWAIGLVVEAVRLGQPAPKPGRPPSRSVRRRRS